MNRAIIQAQRDAMQAEQDRDELLFARQEEQIKLLQADLAARGRTMDMRHGAIGALDSVLSLSDAESVPPRQLATLRERLIGFVRVPVWRGW